jgi:hypothetical protein
MSDEEHERARQNAEEAARQARERAMNDAERLKAEAFTGPIKEEMLRQLGLIYGGLILIACTWSSRSSRLHRSTPPPRSPSSRSRWRSRSSPRS